MFPSGAPLDSFGMSREMLRSRATPLRAAAVGGDGAWLVQWANADTETIYERLEHHTLSLYLQGGHQVRNLDLPSARGAPGSLCCMPAGHRSHWEVKGSLQLLHLYLPTLPLALAAEQWFDRDPRLAHLQDRIWFEDEVLSGLGQRVVALDWTETDAALALQELTLRLQARLLQAHGGLRMPEAAATWRGGLSPAARRRVLEAVEAAPDGSPSLDDLAAAACLSPFHFVRMFKQSFGLSPHAWVMQRRLAKARALLADARLPLAQVAADAGYAHLSHLNAALQRARLGSAARWRRVNLQD